MQQQKAHRCTRCQPEALRFKSRGSFYKNPEQLRVQTAPSRDAQTWDTRWWRTAWEVEKSEEIRCLSISVFFQSFPQRESTMNPATSLRGLHHFRPNVSSRKYLNFKKSTGYITAVISVVLDGNYKKKRQKVDFFEPPEFLVPFLVSFLVSLLVSFLVTSLVSFLVSFLGSSLVSSLDSSSVSWFPHWFPPWFPP